MSHEHRFEAELNWTNDRGATSDYRSYSRNHVVAVEGKSLLHVSAAAAFKGDATLHNPEDLLMAALASCHCLSYLSLCARNDIHVVLYEDRATGLMEMKEGKIRFTEVVLHPRVTIEKGDVEKARALHHRAHEECFIASSVNFEVRNEPEIVVR